MKLSVVSADDVAKAIESDLRFSFSAESTSVAAACEHLRAAVALDAVDPSNEGRYPVPTVRLTQPLVARLHPLWAHFKSDGADAVSNELAHLESLGDLVHSNGKWYITPLRLIEIDGGDCLLVGGGPLHIFPFHLRSEAQFIGRARILTVCEKNRGLVAKLPFQRMEDWLGILHNDILIWSEAFQKSCIKRASPTNEIEDAFAYVSNRWIPFDQYRSMRSTVLFRRTVFIYGAKTFAYGLAKVLPMPESPPQVLAVVDIGKDDARRLQGASQDNGKRRHLEYANRGELVLLRVPHPLPRPENRFLSLGWPARGSETPKQWPKDFYFSRRLLPIIGRALSYLGYDLKEKKESERHGK